MSKLFVFALLVLLPVSLASELEQPKDVCTSTCVQGLYKKYCGGAECVHGAKTEEQKEAMCSDTCLDALFGEPLLECLAKDLPRGADTRDFQEFLMEGITSKKIFIQDYFTDG